MVVGIHAGFLSDVSKTASFMLSNGLFRIAVPLFLLVNGFFFYSVIKKEAHKLWFKRVFILYIFWMTFYVYFWIPTTLPFTDAILSIIRKIIFGHFHLWYVAGMIPSAFLLILIRNLPSKLLLALSAFLAIVGVMIQYLGNYHFFIGTPLDSLFNYRETHRNALFFCFPFLYIGFFLNKYDVINKLSLKTVITSTVVGLAFLMIESYYNLIQSSRDGGFDNYFSIFFLCPFILIIFLKVSIKGKSKRLALLSSGIYFFHAFFLSILNKFTELSSTPKTFVCFLYQ